MGHSPASASDRHDDGMIFWGEQILPTSTPLPFYAYRFLVMTFIGCELVDR
jgi:hypothetical protein